MAKVITTVLGDIAPQDLGVVDFHEHLFPEFPMFKELKKNLPPVPEERLALKPENMLFLRSDGLMYTEEFWSYDREKNLDYIVREAELYRNAGGNAILEPSAADLRNSDTDSMKAISQRTGVHLIMTTGAFADFRTPPEWFEKSDEELYDIFHKEIKEGIGDSEVKAGAVKTSIGEYNEERTGINEKTWRVVKVCARVARDTGLPLLVHTSFNKGGADLIREAAFYLVDEIGVDPDQLVILHMDAFIHDSVMVQEYVASEKEKGFHLELALSLLEKGINIGIDNWGLASVGIDQYPFLYADNVTRLKFIYQLIQRGYSDKITWGHDNCARWLAKQDGGCGYCYFLEFAIPRLRELGVAEKDIQNILVNAPARILSHEKFYITGASCIIQI